MKISKHFTLLWFDGICRRDNQNENWSCNGDQHVFWLYIWFDTWRILSINSKKVDQHV